jgi:hypothetical protein
MIQLVLFSDVERSGKTNPFNKHFWKTLKYNKWKGHAFKNWEETKPVVGGKRKEPPEKNEKLYFQA